MFAGLPLVRITPQNKRTGGDVASSHRFRSRPEKQPVHITSDITNYHNMKTFLQLIFTTLLCLLPTITRAQHKMPPLPTNKDTLLVHQLALIGHDKALGKQIDSLVQQQIDKNQWSIQLRHDVGTYPDIVLLLDDDAAILEHEECRYSQTIQLLFPGKKSLDVMHRISVKDAEDAARQITKFIRKTFYSGMRPSYSTVFTSGEEGYASYRVPAVMALPNGRILSIAEGRNSTRTDYAENDIVMKYTDDDGQTWSPLFRIAEAGAASLNNPTGVYIEELHRILVLFQEYPPKMNSALVRPGLKGKNIVRTYVIYSDDYGQTWSKKKEITNEVKQPEATSYTTGPGAGIRVTAGPDKGRILIPVNVSGGKNGWYNYLVASDDLGKSWHILPQQSDYGTSESQIVQVGESSFALNARCHRYEGIEVDQPYNWNPWNYGQVTRNRGMISVNISGERMLWYETQIRQDLPDPLCQGSIIRYSGLNGDDRSRLLFSNPASQFSYATGKKYSRTAPARVNGTVRVSYDNGKTWAHSKRIYGNRFTEFQYSVLAHTASNRIACLFEAAPIIKMAVFDMKWLTSGEDKGK